MKESRSAWITWEQFKRLGEKCEKCDKTATHISSLGDWASYCDEHFPYKQEKEVIDVQRM